MSHQAQCQALIQSKCGPGERGHVTVYDAEFTDDRGRKQIVDKDGIAQRVAEAFTSRNGSPNAPVEQRNNRVVVRVPYRVGSVSKRPNGDERASDALATEAAFAQLLEKLSRPAAPHPVETKVAELKASVDAQAKHVFAQDEMIREKDAEILSLQSALDAKGADADVATKLAASVSEKNAEIAQLRAELEAKHAAPPPPVEDAKAEDPKPSEPTS